MSPKEFDRLQRFVQVGNGTGDFRVKLAADGVRQRFLNYLLARTTLVLKYADFLNKQVNKLMESSRSEEAYYGHLCRFLGDQIDDPGFDSEAADFALVIRDAGDSALLLVHDESCELIVSCLNHMLNDIGSDLERRSD